ncbi:DUF262 domain-containing protein [Mesomycoplasma moatsii]|uniref:DUF262 domain-containing protein n=1 Tax=Mesomycoplasma moatsii TaxID=171287 RepID=UPI0003B47AA0
MSNNIKIEKVNINELLDQTNGSIIPYYQRDYDWGEKEIERLIYDLISNKSNEYYCGSIVLCNHLDSKKIVDGQQRISTFLLIIKYLKYFLKSNNKKDKFINIENYQIDSNNLKDKEILQELIQTREENELLEIKNKYPNSRYVQNFLIINERFKQMNVKDIEKFISIFEKIIFSLVIVTQDYDEYRLFTNINSTGLPLNAFDLVKNFIFSKMELNEKQIKEKLKIINEISNYLEIDEGTDKPLDNKKKNSNLNELIRLFNAYETGIFEKSESTMLFRKFEKIYKDNYEENIDKMFDEFIKFSSYYKFIKTKLENEKYNFYKSMRIIGLQFDTFITLIIDILKKNSNYNKYSLDIFFNDEQEQEIEKSLLVIESFSLFRTYTNMRSNDLSRFIPTLHNKIKTYNKYSYSTSLLKTLYFDQKNSDLNTKMPSKNTFLKAIIDATDIYNNKKKSTEKLLIRIDEYLNEKENNKNTSKYSKISIEHILPQNYEKWILEDSDLNEYEIDNYVNSLGNLTILPGKLNNELKNSIFKIKKNKLLEKGTFIINNYLNKKEYWDINSIEERMKWLVNIINKIYNLDSIFLELNEPLEKSDIEWLVENRDIKKIDDESKYWSTIKTNTQKLNIKITYEKICDAIYEYCFYNQSQTTIAKRIFNVPTENNKLKDNNWTIWSIFKILRLEKIHKNKTEEWVKSFIKQNKHLINEIADFCNN